MSFLYRSVGLLAQGATTHRAKAHRGGRAMALCLKGFMLLALAWPALHVRAQEPRQERPRGVLLHQGSAAELRAMARDRYIIRLLPSTDARAQAAVLDAVEKSGGQIGHVYRTVLTGFSAVLPAASVEVLSRLPWVQSIEPDAVVSTSPLGSQPIHAQAASAAASRQGMQGLDRLDQRDLPLDGMTSSQNWGQGVHIYVIDTGVRASHTEFGGRVLPGHSVYVGDAPGTEDCNGHGTHVAGIAAGANFGVAKQASIVPVRILNCQGSAYSSDVIAGIDWVAANARKPAVASISFGGAAHAATDAAVDRLIASGVLASVSAGNDTADACTKSPAKVGQALTVASSATNDTQAYYSNFGACVDVFAWGDSVVSAVSSGDSDYASMSGTSMAQPLVAGLAATALARNPGLVPSQVHDLVVATATVGRLGNLSANTPNRLAYALLDDPKGEADRVLKVWATQATPLAEKTPNGLYWKASLKLKIVNQFGPVNGAQVSVSAGALNALTCTTDALGVCSVSASLLRLTSPSVEMRITDVKLPKHVHAPENGVKSGYTLNAP